MPIVQLLDVHKKYPLGKTEVHAVKGVTFEIEEGDFISIAGPSGSGKSTILNLIGCIDTPTEGIVRIDGTPTSELSDREITTLRHKVLGFIFQSFNLVPVLNVFENVEFPLLLGKVVQSKQERVDWIDHLIESVGLAEWRDHKPNELSGGQRQRVAIARALATKPRIVLADEPTANLDSTTGEAIIELMKRMNEELGTTFIFSTHDPSIVGIADHIIRLLDGRITENVRTGGAGGSKTESASGPTAVGTGS
jgi:putative ABC transport system ATP-binding protein